MSRTDNTRPFWIQANDPHNRRTGMVRVWHDHGNSRYHGRNSSEYHPCDLDAPVTRDTSWRTQTCVYNPRWIADNWSKSKQYYARQCNRSDRVRVRNTIADVLKTRDWDSADIYSGVRDISWRLD